MKIAIRCDDIGWTDKAAEPMPMKQRDVGFELAQRFHAAMGGVPYLGAIIPSMADGEAVEWLQSKPAGLVPALHGWDHRMREGERSEFAGLSVVAMRDLLDNGRAVIGRTRHLVPPFNAMAPGLAEACFHEGVKYVWGGPVEWPTPPSPLELEQGTLLIPAWARIYGATNWPQGTCRPLLETCEPSFLDLPGLAVLTLHITWEAARDPDFRGIARLAGRIGPWTISPDEFAEACR
jgi:hypothetical protein